MRSKGRGACQWGWWVWRAWLRGLEITGMPMSFVVNVYLGADYNNNQGLRRINPLAGA